MRFKKLGVYLRKLRKRAGLSQVEVSQKLGYRSNQFISNWERGLSYPPMKVLSGLALLYGVSDDSIYKELEKVVVAEVKRSLTAEFKSLNLKGP